MRIGLFTDAYVPQIGGVSSSCLLLKNELGKRGHKIYIFTTSDPGAPVEESNVIRVPSLPFVSAKRVALNYNPLLSKRVRKLDLDVIHTQTEFGLGIFGRSICRQTGIPHVHTYHTIYEDWVHGQLKRGPIDLIARDYVRRLSRTFCNSAQRIVVPTEKTRALLLSYGVHKPIEIIPTGIRLIQYREAKANRAAVLELREKLGIGEDERVLLYLGRVSDEKNIAELFDYLAEFLPRRPELRFVLVGDGPARSELMRFAERRRLLPQVVFTGAVAVDQVSRYYALADIFLSASRSETQGLTYIEALAAGLPLLVRKDECLEGVVQEGVNGYFFEDRESFCERLESLLDLKAEPFAALSASAMASTAAYSVETFAQKVEALYLSQMEQGGRFGQERHWL